jgi:hypothetical protein
VSKLNAPGLLMLVLWSLFSVLVLCSYYDLVKLKVGYAYQISFVKPDPDSIGSLVPDPDPGRPADPLPLPTIFFKFLYYEGWMFFLKALSQGC